MKITRCVFNGAPAYEIYISWSVPASRLGQLIHEFLNQGGVEATWARYSLNSYSLNSNPMPAMPEFDVNQVEKLFGNTDPDARVLQAKMLQIAMHCTDNTDMPDVEFIKRLAECSEDILISAGRNVRQNELRQFDQQDWLTIRAISLVLPTDEQAIAKQQAAIPNEVKAIHLVCDNTLGERPPTLRLQGLPKWVLDCVGSNLDEVAERVSTVRMVSAVWGCGEVIDFIRYLVAVAINCNQVDYLAEELNSLNYSNRPVIAGRLSLGLIGAGSTSHTFYFSTFRDSDEVPDDWVRLCKINPATGALIAAVVKPQSGRRLRIKQ